MSGRSMVERLRWRVQADTHDELAHELGISVYLVRQFLMGRVDERGDVRISLLMKISESSSTPIGMLAEWFAEPEDEGLAAAAQSARLSFPTLSMGK